MVITHWKRLLAMCREAACVIPGISLQDWDISVTDDGPVFVEMNIGGDFTLPQLGHAQGMLDEPFKAYLDAHAYRPLRPSRGVELMQSLRRCVAAARNARERAL